MSSLGLVIFDCDGVLVDSEGAASSAVARELTAMGWPMTDLEAMGLFVGMTLEDMVPMVEARLGTLPADWPERLRGTLIAAMANEATPMPGIPAVLHAVSALGLPWRVASNSSHAEMDVKFARTGLAGVVGNRKHSSDDVARGKPAPDVFLAAAAAEGMPPARCLVVEDSVLGARGAVAAGMDVVGLVPHGDGAALRAEGARIIGHLDELPALLLARQAA